MKNQTWEQFEQQFGTAALKEEQAMVEYFAAMYDPSYTEEEADVA